MNYDTLPDREKPDQYPIRTAEPLSEELAVKTRGVAALYLYRETVALLRSAMQSDHLEVAEQAIQVVDEALALLSSMV